MASILIQSYSSSDYRGIILPAFYAEINQSVFELQLWLGMILFLYLHYILFLFIFQRSFFNPHIHSRHLCSTHPQLQSYMISHQCSTSWISAIQEAAEAAMLRHNQTVHFSFDFIKECAPIDDDGWNGMHVIERNKRVSKSSFIIGFHLFTKLGIMNKRCSIDWLITK